MKKADQTVTATEASAYTQTKITEHSLSPTPNSCIIVPEKYIFFSLLTNMHAHNICITFLLGKKSITNVHCGWHGVLQVEDELVQRVWLDEAQPDGSLHQRGAEQRQQDVSHGYDAGYYRRRNSCPASYSCGSKSESFTRHACLWLMHAYCCLWSEQTKARLPTVQKVCSHDQRHGRNRSSTVQRIINPWKGKD